jgi:hypothetical protein
MAQRESQDGIEPAHDSSGRNHPMRNVFGRPYINVMRMHLLIFFFAGAHFAGLESFWVFGMVYFLYFFPWRLFKSAEHKGAAPA